MSSWPHQHTIFESCTRLGTITNSQIGMLVACQMELFLSQSQLPAPASRQVGSVLQLLPGYCGWPLGCIFVFHARGLPLAQGSSNNYISFRVSFLFPGLMGQHATSPVCLPQHIFLHSL